MLSGSILSSKYGVHPQAPARSDQASDQFQAVRAALHNGSASPTDTTFEKRLAELNRRLQRVHRLGGKFAQVDFSDYVKRLTGYHQS